MACKPSASVGSGEATVSPNEVQVYFEKEHYLYYLEKIWTVTLRRRS